MSRPRWEWTLHNNAGEVVPASPGPIFPTRFEAEQWLGEQWRTLSVTGVQTATLIYDGKQVGAPLELLV